MRDIAVPISFCRGWRSRVIAALLVFLLGHPLSRAAEDYFLPICGFSQPTSASHVSYGRSLGLNTFVGNPVREAMPSAVFLDELKARGMKGVIDYDSAVKNHSALLGWMLFDEPDAAGVSTSTVQTAHNLVKSSDTLHPVVVKVADGFYADGNYTYMPPALNGDRAPYIGYAQSADILSFSMYPVSQWNKPEWLYVPGISSALLKTFGQNRKPVWSFIEASDGDFPSVPESFRGPTAQEVAFQVWDSIILGATGIGYQTRRFSSAEWMHLDPAVEEEMRRTNSELESMRKAILACPTQPGISATESQGKSFHFTSRRTGSRCYIFVTNADMTGAAETVTFSLGRLLGRVSEIRSKRVIPISGNSFTDGLPPLGVAIYEIQLLPPSDIGDDYYVSPHGNNYDGTSWTNAWTELDQINWDAIKPNDTIYIDGGTSWTLYTSALVVGKGGTGELSRIVIRRSDEPGHNGTVKIEGSIKIWQPYVTLDGGEASKFLVYPADYMSSLFLGYWDEDTTASEIWNASFLGSYANPYGISVSVYGADCLVKGCVFDRSGGEDMLAIMSEGDVTVEDCLFKNLIGSEDPLCHRDVISVYPGIAAGKIFYLRNNVFENNRTDNFAVFPLEGAILGGFEIWGNTFRYCNKAIHLDDRVGGADYININNNVFDNVDIYIHNDSPVAIDDRFNLGIDSEGPTPTPALEPTRTPTPTATPNARPNNKAPIADAGPDLDAEERSAVALCASGSSDPDGDIFSYRWTQAGGSKAAIGNSEACTATLLLPALANDETLSFELEVSDGLISSSDTVNVMVRHVDRPPDSGLVAAFSFEKFSRNSVLDSSGYQNDGIIEGAVRTASGYRGSAMEFDGVNDLITLPNYPLLNLTSGMTLEAWVYPSADMLGWHPIICKESEDGILYSLYANCPGSSPAGVLQVSGEKSLEAGPQVEKEKWTFLSSTFDGETHRLYVNGVAVGEMNLTGALDVAIGPVRIGADIFWDEYFSGKIDEVRIYSLALTQQEIVDDMNKAVPSLTNAGQWTLYE